jgi:hypothetical protein
VSIPEEVGKVASSAIDVMKGSPALAILLVVNVVFLAFATYVLGEVAANASERNKAQLELITKLVSDCRQPGQT